MTTRRKVPTVNEFSPVRELWLWLRADWRHAAKAFGAACGVAVLAVMGLILFAFFLALSKGVSR